ncbi:AI-2E family transporter [Patescibacteria group bacterium]|nr:AI-2E family transporter [Patescibacteria group bacterium]
MKIERRHLLYIIFGLALLAVLYAVRSVLMPFILAAIFAYLLNPLVTFLTHRLKLPRPLAIALIYILIIGGLAAIAINVGVRFGQESDEFAAEARNFIRQTNSQITLLPEWLQPFALDAFESVRASLLLPNRRVTAYLPGALNRTVSLLVFLVAAFYFLKDGHSFQKNLLNFLPAKTREEGTEILAKINQVLGNYLRGQLLLIAIMAVFTYIGLILIGVRYALILAIFTGFAEIVPLIGPVMAAAVATIVAFTDQFSRLGPVPFLDVIAVISLYTVLRQAEDLFIIPQVMGRATKLHPLLVMFAVLAGGHLFGVVGYVLAVPVVASIKVIINHIWGANMV